jgi:hypothetical protein
MNVTCKPAFKLAVVFLVFSIGQLYVLGGPNMYATPLPQEPIGSTVGLLNGKLIVDEDETVLVNGNKVTSGTTILPGAEIDTPDKVFATVALPSGSVTILPNTSLTLSFGADTVRVNLTTGCATLQTNQNVRGEMITNQTLAWSSDPSKRDTAAVCMDQSGRATVMQRETRETVSEDVALCGQEDFEIPVAGRGFPAKLLLYAAGAAIFGGLLLTNDHPNPSPGTPTV